jgi:hypothetical protein
MSSPSFSISSAYAQIYFREPFYTEDDQLEKRGLNMKKIRQLHLWIGLICSVFILIESITGLLLSEQSLLGSGGDMKGRPTQAAAGLNAPMKGDRTSSADQNASGAAPQGSRPQFGGDGAIRQGGDTSLMGIIKGLHEGKIGTTNVRWLIDLTAIGMIVLTLTGITMSIKTLRAQSIQRKRRAVAEG